MNDRQSATKFTALYERLSRDDESQGESNSIVSQKIILEDYAKKNGFENLLHFTDDGVSGTTFEREGFKSMIAEIEAGNIGTVICKGMSRFGRDYLQVGYYTEIFFRQKGVRFIAVSNNIDSQNGENNEFAPFLNIMAEWYARDASRKQKAVYQSKGNNGKRTTNGIIFGYLKDPNDRTKWVVDPEVAAIVRRIFNMCVGGMGSFQIARTLTQEKIETPGYYLGKLGIGTRKNAVYKNPCLWSGTIISNILVKPKYMGNTVNFRLHKESFKEKKQTHNPKEDWVIFENTHEAIVDSGTWHTAQKCRTVKRRTDTTGESNPLTGILYCADCGSRLFNHRHRPSQKISKATGNTIHESERSDYYCPTYAKTKSRGIDAECSVHFIGSTTANMLILETIKRVSGYAHSNEAEFVKMLREASAVKQDETAKAHKKRIAKNEKRIAELDVLFRKTYEDYAAGRLNEKRFEQLSGGYEREQADLETQTAELKTELERFSDDRIRADKFMEFVKKHTNFTELTAHMLHEFVEKVVVHEADKSSGRREQQVDIYLNFIGKFDVPDWFETEEAPPEPLSPEDEKRSKWRDYKRREREKKLQEKLSAKDKTA